MRSGIAFSSAFFLVIALSIVVGQATTIQSASSSSTSENDATLYVRLHYPDAMMCAKCSFLLGSDFNWTMFIGYAPDHVTLLPNPQLTMVHTTVNLWTLELHYNFDQFRNKYIELTPSRWVSAWGADTQCPINYAVVRNLGDRTFVHLTEKMQGVDLYPYFCRQNGELQMLPNVYSPQLNNTRPIFVYLPPSLAENPIPRMAPGRMTNIVFMSDGQIIMWFNRTLEALAIGAAMKETVVVGITSNAEDRMYELTFSPCKQCMNCPDGGNDPNAPCNCTIVDPSNHTGGTDLYLDFAENTLLPMIKHKYGLQSDRSTQAFSGASLGGLTACYAAYTRSQTFSKAHCASPSLWWNCEQFLKEVAPKHTPLEGTQLYIDVGTAEGSIMNLPLHHIEKFLVNERSHIFKMGKTLWIDFSWGDLHDNNSWLRRSFSSLPKLFGPEPEPAQDERVNPSATNPMPFTNLPNDIFLSLTAAKSAEQRALMH